MGWGEKGKRFLHFGMCSFFLFFFSCKDYKLRLTNLLLHMKMKKRYQRLQVLLNQVTSEEDEKEIVSMKYESSPSNQGQPIEILENVEQVILLVSNKPIKSKAMVAVKSLLTSLERIFKTYLFNISKDFLVVFG